MVRGLRPCPKQDDVSGSRWAEAAPTVPQMVPVSTYLDTVGGIAAFIGLVF
jgi:hypothetical protein